MVCLSSGFDTSIKQQKPLEVLCFFHSLSHFIYMMMSPEPTDSKELWEVQENSMCRYHVIVICGHVGCCSADFFARVCVCVFVQRSTTMQI